MQNYSRFSQNFIDIREKERKRGARGLVTVPKVTETMGNETAADNSTSTTTIVTTTTLSPEEQAKADEMLKLQQKITQEILNSNLKEKEMNELQVSY
jgi:wingless-type MMTV integration site family protein 5